MMKLLVLCGRTMFTIRSIPLKRVQKLLGDLANSGGGSSTRRYPHLGVHPPGDPARSGTDWNIGRFPFFLMFKLSRVIRIILIQTLIIFERGAPRPCCVCGHTASWLLRASAIITESRIILFLAK